MTPHKNKKADQIEKTIEIVSKYFGCDPHKVLTSYCGNGAAVANARCLIWYHLHDCGISYCAIGRIFGGLSIDHVQKRARQGMLRLNEENRLVIATLPKIQNSLDIKKADGP